MTLKLKDTMMMATGDYLARAMAAWLRGSTTGVAPQYPHHAMSMEVTVHGKEYVVLANSAQVLGVYRIRPNGVLKLLKRWPKAVETAAGWPQEEIVS
jgi:hypothetical protein